MKAHISDEQGNVGLIGIILASVVGVTGLVLQNQAQKTSTKMAMTQIERAVDTIEMRNASQLSRTLGLFSVGGGRTVPAVYPVNYFD
ncbi:MAG: hypothetical protein NTX25_04360, partial [Proteobacteria bacterium]|nr:hypothetical protein [Pseudomonadota bacterium]